MCHNRTHAPPQLPEPALLIVRFRGLSGQMVRPLAPLPLVRTSRSSIVPLPRSARNRQHRDFHGQVFGRLPPENSSQVTRKLRLSDNEAPSFLKSEHLVQSIRNLELTGVGRPFINTLGDRLDHQAVELFDARGRCGRSEPRPLWRARHFASRRLSFRHVALQVPSLPLGRPNARHCRLKAALDQAAPQEGQRLEPCLLQSLRAASQAE